MASSVFIDGAVGTTGLEIRERLEGRGEFSLLTLDDARRKDPAARREALNEADFAILCLPDDAAREAVAMIDAGSGTRVIDASTAHRTAPGWTYGFPELVGRTAVAEAERVSNPGCYPTGFLALVAPLVRAGLLPADWPYSVHAVSGYSGGGKAMIERFEGDPDMAWRGYGLHGGHKHLAEMQAMAGLARPPVFCPAVVPAHRGMMVEVPLALSALPEAPAPSVLLDALAEFYAGSPVVTVRATDAELGELLLRRSDSGSDGLDLHVFGSADGSQARLIALLDNLGKGASGAAIQSLNLMAGLDESTGLRL
jgi:N-acetyl-gamma-glutamyl-phosphate reductase